MPAYTRIIGGSVPAKTRPRPMWLAGWLLLAPLIAATPPQTAYAADGFRITATEDRLWLVEVDVETSRIHTRDRTPTFSVARRAVNGHVTELTAQDDELFAFFADRTCYSVRAGDDTLRPERTLPDRSLPVTVQALDGNVYALVAASAAAAMLSADDSTDANTPPPAPLAIDAGDKRLWLVYYDRQQWRPIIDTPIQHDTALSENLRPRLLPVAGELRLFWTGADAASIRSARVDLAKPALHDEHVVARQPVRAFWPLLVNRIPTLVIIAPDSGNNPGLQTLRATGPGGLTEGVWTATAPTFATTDVPKNCMAAFAFNQHLGLLTRTHDGQDELRFARFGDRPVEPDVLLADALRGPDEERPYAAPLQVVSFAVLMAAVAVVFLWRRRTLVTPAALPPDRAIAFLLQRTAAMAIDLVPFTLIAALLLKLDWQTSWLEVIGWAVGSDLTAEGVPGLPVIAWWVYSAVCYTTYSLIMELLTRRTIGKVLLRIEVATEDGTRPRPGQILVRNVLRLAELLPPVWALVFLVFLTPRRQRVGDAIARTIIIRYLGRDGKKTPASEGDDPPPRQEPPDSSDES
ncbi:MAG: RDD family protein [Phycisphaerae bacterium]|nr:RDD family protein [Phycisphaerae bacterium]